MIAVAGATGTTGRQVVAELLGRGADVRALTRDPEKAKTILGREVQIAAADFERRDTLEVALRGAEVIYLLAADSPRMVQQEGNVMEAAAAAGVRRIVKQSALGADPGSPIHLLCWHAQSERRLRASGLAFTILQPNFYMQNFSDFAPSIVADGRFYAPMKAGRLSMVDGRDVAAVAAAALTEGGHAGATHVITGPQGLSFARAADELTAALGTEIRYLDLPPEDARQGMLDEGMPGWLVDDMIGLFQAFSQDHGAMVTDVVRRVGRREPRTFAEFARENAAAFTMHGSKDQSKATGS
jgi:uncharacterized protein YbjT (DUF2867 family)